MLPSLRPIASVKLKTATGRGVPIYGVVDSFILCCHSKGPCFHWRSKMGVVIPLTSDSGDMLEGSRLTVSLWIQQMAFPHPKATRHSRWSSSSSNRCRMFVMANECNVDKNKWRPWWSTASIFRDLQCKTDTEATNLDYSVHYFLGEQAHTYLSW